MTLDTALWTPNFREALEGLFSDGRTDEVRQIANIFAVCICNFVENDQKSEIERQHREKRNTEPPFY